MSTVVRKLLPRQRSALIRKEKEEDVITRIASIADDVTSEDGTLVAWMLGCYQLWASGNVSSPAVSITHPVTGSVPLWNHYITSPTGDGTSFANGNYVLRATNNAGTSPTDIMWINRATGQLYTAGMDRASVNWSTQATASIAEPNCTFTNAVANVAYDKDGNNVSVWGTLSWSTQSGTPGGDLTIDLPCVANAASHPFVFAASNGSQTRAGAWVVGGTSKLTFFSLTSSSMNLHYNTPTGDNIKFHGNFPTQDISF